MHSPNAIMSLKKSKVQHTEDGSKDNEPLAQLKSTQLNLPSLLQVVFGPSENYILRLFKLLQLFAVQLPLPAP